MTGAVPDAAVRPATEDDQPVLEAMAARAAASLEGARGAALLLARESTQPDDTTSFIGTLDGVAVGGIAGHIEDLPGGVRLAVVTFFWVDEEARSVGVGEALLNTVVDWARANGCQSVDAYALPGERITKNFFEAAGFKARLLTVHHDL